MHFRAIFAIALLIVCASSFVRAEKPAPTAAAGVATVKEGSTFPAQDTLNCAPDSTADATACLDGLKWKCEAFTVRCEPGKEGFGDWLIRFPSPAPVGDVTNDLVAMEWYMARDENGQPKRVPAVVVIHESGRGMVAGRVVAKGLRNTGLHTFLIHLPGYGARTSEFTRDMKKMLPGMRQAVADVRRARDAVAVLPHIDASLIGVQGTSLGGFVAATVAGLDRGYDKAFILLAGGRIADVLLNGNRDAANMRRQLASVGVTDQQIKELSQVIEPMRLAHRVDPGRTWLFSGKFDEVVPPSCSLAFAEAANLKGEHHAVLPVGHYTAAVLLPVILPKVGEFMLRRTVEKPETTEPAGK